MPTVTTQYRYPDSQLPLPDGKKAEIRLCEHILDQNKIYVRKAWVEETDTLGNLSMSLLPNQSDSYYEIRHPDGSTDRFVVPATPATHDLSALIEFYRSEVAGKQVFNFPSIIKGDAGPSGALQKYQIPMQAGVLVYPLPAIPAGVTLAFINGVEVSYTLSGVNLTITEYTAGSIESDDVLTVYF